MAKSRIVTERPQIPICIKSSRLIISDMPKAIFVKDLVKEFSKRRAVDGLSLEVDEGEVFGLIGPNGAGKTTTLRVIATIIKPTSGQVTVCGKDVVRESAEVRRLARTRTSPGSSTSGSWLHSTTRVRRMWRLRWRRE